MEKSLGKTKTEKVLAQLCENTFLNLWSYPNPYFKKNHELCDVLVICDNTIIIFSDKNISFSNLDDIQLAWIRWHKRAIKKSIKQLRRAKNWIINNPTEIYLDVRCGNKMPITIPDTKYFKIHLIVVANGAKNKCAEYYGDGCSGSLIYAPIFASNGHPFTIGNENCDDTYVHIFDEFTLPIILQELDTVSDFIKYLEEKENFIALGKGLIYPGEEDLLAHYLACYDEEKKKHTFLLSDYSQHFQNVDGIVIPEGQWKSIKSHLQYRAKKKADAISYFWDCLIKKFTVHMLNGTIVSKRYGAAKQEKHEGGVRYMALEPRVYRRLLSKQLMYDIERMPNSPNGCLMSSCFSYTPDAQYIFVQLHYDGIANYDDYRQRRSELLYAYCMSAKVYLPKLTKVIGIATEPPKYNSNNQISYDMVMLDCSKSKWTDARQLEAENLRNRFKLFQGDKLTKKMVGEKEFPEI